MSELTDGVIEECRAEMARASLRYGPFTSTHEALGVLREEFTELTHAVRQNALESVRMEAIQVAAVALRLAVHCREHAAFAARSVP